MARACPAYHSEDGFVHHIYSDCTAGNNIERDNKSSGTGGKRLCSICRDIRDGKRTR